MIKKIDHINIVVRDLGGAKKFFLQFGFEIAREGNLSGEWIETLTRLKNVKARYAALSLPGHETNLELLTFDSPVGEECPAIDVLTTIGYRHIAFAVENIEKVVDDLKAQGVTFFSEIRRYEEAKKKLCYFYGPEGIVLELAEYN
jgi:catechol 2,3-dioxygenase-like lactoylglutathione lyase family enzyme